MPTIQKFMLFHKEPPLILATTKAIAALSKAIPTPKKAELLAVTILMPRSNKRLSNLSTAVLTYLIS